MSGVTVAAPTAYDEVIFDNHPFAQAHPSRLATIATLFGLNPAPVEVCRVLDLGCAVGGHIIPLAELYPQSEFVGVDLSARQIAEGQKAIQSAGLQNISLRHASIMDVNESYGTFDYIICHGVFSWVPEEVRQKILSICSRNLNPTGVAYVSYNTYPGWNMRGTIRDTMRFHTKRIEHPAQKLEQARKVLEAMSQATTPDTSEYGTQLRQEVDFLRTQGDSYLYHEYLVGENVPCYFHQFIEMAQQQGVRYLGEARMSTMPMSCPPAIQKVLGPIASDQIQLEQSLDVLRNRPFRESLLIPASTNLNWTIRAESIRKLHVTVPRRPKDEAVDVRSNTPTQYTYTGAPQTTTSPHLKAAIRILGQRWPGTVSFAELENGVQQLLGTPSNGGQELAGALLTTYLASELIELHAMPIPFVPARERPIALSAARASVGAGWPGVPTRRHEYLKTNELDLHILPLLDGSNDGNAILNKLVQLAASGELQVHLAGQPVTDPMALRETLGRAVQGAMERYTNTSILKG